MGGKTIKNIFSTACESCWLSAVPLVGLAGGRGDTTRERGVG